MLPLNIIACPSLIANNCDITCGMEYKTVCGSNGKTYANICVLKAEACAKKTTITVASEGECSGRIHRVFYTGCHKNIVPRLCSRCRGALASIVSIFAHLLRSDFSLDLETLFESA